MEVKSEAYQEASRSSQEPARHKNGNFLRQAEGTAEGQTLKALALWRQHRTLTSKVRTYTKLVFTILTIHFRMALISLGLRGAGEVFPPPLRRTKGTNKDTEESFPTHLIMYVLHLKQLPRQLQRTTVGRPDTIPTIKCSHFSHSLRLSDSAVAYNLANALTLLTTLCSPPLWALLQFLPPGLCVDFLPCLFFGMDNNQGSKLQ